MARIKSFDANSQLLRQLQRWCRFRPSPFDNWKSAWQPSMLSKSGKQTEVFNEESP